MAEQALQALDFLLKHGPSRLGTDISILNKLMVSGLIGIYDLTTRTYILTSYGKGVLEEIRKVGTDAMMKRVESYLK